MMPLPYEILHSGYWEQAKLQYLCDTGPRSLEFLQVAPSLPWVVPPTKAQVLISVPLSN